MDDPTPNLVPAVDRAIQILQAFDSADDSYGATDLSRMLDLNKSTVFDILTTLTYHNFLERNEETKKYHLGPALFHLGNLVGERLSVREVAHPFVRDLSTSYSATVILASFTPKQRVLIVDSAEPELDIKISVSVGSRITHWAGIFGKIFHAAMNEPELHELRKRASANALHLRAIDEPERYAAQLARIREQGYATDEEEFLAGVRAIGIPINDREGRVAAALIIMDFKRALNDRKMEQLGEILPRIGRRISERLGARHYPQWNGTWAE